MDGAPRPPPGRRAAADPAALERLCFDAALALGLSEPACAAELTPSQLEAVLAAQRRAQAAAASLQLNNLTAAIAGAFGGRDGERALREWAANLDRLSGHAPPRRPDPLAEIRRRAAEAEAPHP